MQIYLSDDDCGESGPYIYCDENVDNATVLYIPPSDTGYDLVLNFVPGSSSSGQKGMALLFVPIYYFIYTFAPITSVCHFT